MTWVLINSKTLKKYPVYVPLDPLARHSHNFLPFISIMQKTCGSKVWVSSLGLPSESGVSQSKNFESAAGHLWRPCPLLKKYIYWFSSILSSQIVRGSPIGFFFREAFSEGLSFFIPFFLSIYIPTMPEISTLLLPLSSKKLSRAQSSYFTCTIARFLAV